MLSEHITNVLELLAQILHPPGKLEIQRTQVVWLVTGIEAEHDAFGKRSPALAANGLELLQTRVIVVVDGLQRFFRRLAGSGALLLWLQVVLRAGRLAA